MLTPQRINQLMNALAFDKDNVAQKALEDDIRMAIKETEADLNEDAVHPNILYKGLYFQVAIAAAYKDRDHKKSVEYFGYYLQCDLAPDSLELAEAYNSIGYAHTMDPTYASEDYFVKAKTILEKLHFDDTVKERKRQHELGVAHRYYGLAFHRRSMGDKLPDTYNQAQQNFKLSAEIFASLAAVNTIIQQAESVHLLGASLLAQGKLQDAIKELTDAYQLELAYIKATGKPHFMLFTTLQTLGDAKRKFAATCDAQTAKQLRLEASAHLLEAQQGQEKHFADTSNNPDYAKTREFAGLIFLDLECYEDAAKELIASLDVKIKAYGSKDHRAVGWTHDSICSLLQKLDVLLPVEGTAKFGAVNQIDTCIALLQKEVEKLSTKCQEQLDQLSKKVQTYKAQTSPKAGSFRTIGAAPATQSSANTDTARSEVSMKRA